MRAPASGREGARRDGRARRLPWPCSARGEYSTGRGAGAGGLPLVHRCADTWWGCSRTPTKRSGCGCRPLAWQQKDAVRKALLNQMETESSAMVRASITAALSSGERENGRAGV